MVRLTDSSDLSIAVYRGCKTTTTTQQRLLSKVNGYTFKDSNSSIFIFALLLSGDWVWGGGSTLKGKNLLLYDQILSLKSWHLLEGFHCNGNQTGCQKMVSNVKVAKKLHMVVCSITC